MTSFLANRVSSRLLRVKTKKQIETLTFGSLPLKVIARGHLNHCAHNYTGHLVGRGGRLRFYRHEVEILNR